MTVDIVRRAERSDAELGIYRPLIMCGRACGWSRHAFARNQRALGTAGGNGVTVIYACLGCGRERVYGNGANVSEFAGIQS